MPVVELALSRLQGLLGGGVSKGTIACTLPFLGLDIESESRNCIRVEYSPNRPDYSTDFGIALGLEGLLGLKRGGVELKVRKSNYQIKADPSVSKIRPYVTGICARGGTVDGGMIKQLMAMQEDLHFGIGRRRKKSSVGIHDLDAVSFPLSYCTRPRSHRFIPLDGTEIMTAERILSDTRTGRDYGSLLGSSGPVPMIVDSKGRTVSFPPVINASLTAVTTKTRNLFVEVTGLNRDDIEDALSVVATVLQKAGFALYQVGISGAKNSAPNLGGRKLVFDPKLVSDTLGLDLSAANIVSCLKKSRIGAASLKSGKIHCAVPRYRFDILGPMDIVEEVALGYGIAGLEPKLSPSQTLGGTVTAVKDLRTVDQMLTGLGYTEALNSSLTSKRVLYDAANREPKRMISVLDSKSQQHTVLRDSILPGLVHSLAGNIHQAYPQRMYETGTVFLGGGTAPIREQVNLAAVLAHRHANFSEIKSVLQSALKTGFDIDTKTKTSSDPIFEKGRAADVLAGGKAVGVIGEISSRTLEYFKIRVPVAGFETRLTGLIFD